MTSKAEIERRLREILDRYGPLLRHAIARTCPGIRGISLDDIEQEARLRLWRHLEREKTIDRPASFLYRVAVTATVDAVRRVRSRREVAMDPGGDDAAASSTMNPTAPQPSPERLADQRELLERVLARLRELPVDRRRAVALHLQGFTTGEIAKLTQWTEPRARNLAYRGLAELRRRLREQGIEYEA